MALEEVEVILFRAALRSGRERRIPPCLSFPRLRIPVLRVHWGALRFSTRPLGSSPRSGGGCSEEEVFFPAARHDFGTKQEKRRFAERLGGCPAAGAGATPAST